MTQNLENALAYSERWLEIIKQNEDEAMIQRKSDVRFWNALVKGSSEPGGAISLTMITSADRKPSKPEYMFPYPHWLI